METDPSFVRVFTEEGLTQCGLTTRHCSGDTDDLSRESGQIEVLIDLLSAGISKAYMGYLQHSRLLYQAVVLISVFLHQWFDTLPGDLGFMYRIE